MYKIKNKPVKNRPLSINVPQTIKFVICTDCDGRGVYLFSSGHYDTEEMCSKCKGTGYVPDKKSRKFLNLLKDFL